jgi:hypothetical protein
LHKTEGCKPLHGIVPKKTSGYRLITPLSYPSSNSVNDFIDKKFSTVLYSSFDKAISIVQKCQCNNVENCSNVEQPIEQPIGIHLSMK